MWQDYPMDFVDFGDDDDSQYPAVFYTKEQ